jgi:hypothetical protein
MSTQSNLETSGRGITDTGSYVVLGSAETDGHGA